MFLPKLKQISRVEKIGQILGFCGDRVIKSPEFSRLNVFGRENSLIF
jgi:hypothetical protein